MCLEKLAQRKNFKSGGVWFLEKKQGQPDAQKAAGLCRACWRFLENLGWSPFFTLRAGTVTTVEWYCYYG